MSDVPQGISKTVNLSTAKQMEPLSNTQYARGKEFSVNRGGRESAKPVNINNASIYSPKSNLSYSTLNSHKSNNKLIKGNYRVEKKLEVQGINGKKIPIASSILNKLRNQNAKKAHQETSVISTVSEKEDSKFVNIALKTAKNVNMYEINNYFQVPKTGGKKVDKKDDQISIDHSTHSKRLENKLKELTKQRNAKILSKPAPDHTHKYDLKSKILATDLGWKTRLTHN